eukprot:g37666.t1
MKFITIFRLLNNDIEVVLMTNDSTTNSFPVWTNVKQGCIITPSLFSIYLAAILHLTIDKLPAGVELSFFVSLMKKMAQHRAERAKMGDRVAEIHLLILYEVRILELIGEAAATYR